MNQNTPTPIFDGDEGVDMNLHVTPPVALFGWEYCRVGCFVPAEAGVLNDAPPSWRQGARGSDASKQHSEEDQSDRLDAS